MKLTAMFTKRWHQTMSQDTETTRKPLNTFIIYSVIWTLCEVSSKDIHQKI